MKKQFIVALAIMVATFSFAQKKELKEAEKAIKDNNFAEAKTLLSQVEPMLSSMDDKYKAQYYYLNAEALYANGSANNDDVAKALKSLGLVQGEYAEESKVLKNSMIQSFVKKGNEAYESKDYSVSSKNFENAYRVSPQDTLYLYYAAVTATGVQEFDRALVLYEELEELNYTGIETEYLAIDKETGEIEVFQSKNIRDISVKGGTHLKPTQRQTESKQGEIVKNMALIYTNQGDNEKALAALSRARKANPDDLNLLITEANLYFKLGDKDKFKDLLQEATERDPKNPELQFNLGVISQESGDLDSAKKYYDKAIELDPNYTNAKINMAAMLLDQEKGLIEEMNSLGSSPADNKRYDELKLERAQIYKSAIPYLESALKSDPSNVDAAKTLMNIYSATGDTDKFKAMKATVESLGG
ncbi:tetratricopeptide repeat protein [Xanthomarina spongicola]|uniref:Tetratricopeptide repeat protein n=1 Tax=Xanthomarina spongicola TaxID=570520 RepID=A0A316DHJ1_9FLAO|nr:tetratricopeptide repeat protein [Xanthomarina spongicola]PWK17118.1 tetratricopeptide repeat protein [Xanthomarina spongicola]